jgi:perosamine synthetase
MHKQPIFKKMNLFNKVKLPVAENLANNGFYLPSGLAITLKQQRYVISKLKEFLNE